MCNPGTSTMMEVSLPAHLSHTGKFRWTMKPIDFCLVPLISRLNEAGILTASCCCGHGKGPGSIILHDGRELTRVEAEALLA